MGVDILQNDLALREQSPVASVCDQGSSDYVIASLFDCVMPSDSIVSGCDFDEPRDCSVVLLSNTAFEAFVCHC